MFSALFIVIVVFTFFLVCLQNYVILNSLRYIILEVALVVFFDNGILCFFYKDCKSTYSSKLHTRLQEYCDRLLQNQKLSNVHIPSAPPFAGHSEMKLDHNSTGRAQSIPSLAQSFTISSDPKTSNIHSATELSSR